jgi:hypothetical protein
VIVGAALLQRCEFEVATLRLLGNRPDMPKWVLPLLILIGLYVLSVGPMVTYFSRTSGKVTMVPSWLRSYGGPYLWLYAQAPEPVQNISDGYFRWCKGMLAKAQEDAGKTPDQPRPPLLLGP